MYARRLLLVASLLVPLLTAAAAGADAPLDLRDPTPRAVNVRFENSPEERPGGLAERWTDPIRAWVEADERPDRLRIRIPARTVEQELLRSRRPLAGSFSDFVWTFDVATGAVVSAELSGTLLYPLEIAFIQADVETRIATRLQTDRAAGFQPPRRVMGRELRYFCAEREADGDCMLVEPRRFDPESGYVNAVGALEVRSPVKSFRAFSTLGEAIFSELGELPAVAASPPPLTEAGSGARAGAGR